MRISRGREKERSVERKEKQEEGRGTTAACERHRTYKILSLSHLVSSRLRILLKQLIGLLIRLLEAVEFEELAVTARPPLRAVLHRTLHEIVRRLNTSSMQKNKESGTHEARRGSPAQKRIANK